MTVGPLFLASASPRRVALLKATGLDVIRFPVEVDETPPAGPPGEVVVELAVRKARAAAGLLEEGVILAADTLVFFEGRIVGKPETTAKAIETLRALSGRSHEVWTGVAVVRLEDRGLWTGAERTLVEFKELPEEAIRAYVETGEPLDKAGGYAIQGEAGVFVKRVEGNVSNVVGLPMGLALRMLAEAGHPVPSRPAPVGEGGNGEA